MKIFLIILVVFIILLFTYSSLSNSFPCTREVEWVSEKEDVTGETGINNQNKIFDDQNNLELTIDWSFLSSKNAPFITLILKNKSTDIQEVQNINIEFFTNEKLIKAIEVSGFDTIEDCETQPCKIRQLPVPINIVLKPNSVFSISYGFKNYVSMSPEKGEIKIELTTKIDTNQKTVTRNIILDKYIRSYNCIFGTGHPFKRIITSVPTLKI